MKTTLETESADQKVRLVSRQDRALFTYQEISVHTETAEITQPAEWVFYDGSCRYCTATARWFALALKRRGIGIAPLQSEWVLARLGLDLSEAMEEMRLLDSTGRVYGGADAIIQLARRTWWSVPLFWISFVPGVMPVLRKGYSRIAAWRSCTRFGRCTLPVRTRSATRPSDWLPLLLLPALVGIVGRHWASWVFMWAMALAIFFGSKWLTWKKAIRFVGSTHWRLTLGYFFGWPGLDAGSFLSRGKGGISKRNGSERNQPAALPWLAAGACVCFGSALILDAARKAGVAADLLVGWEGMVGMVLVLHFGVFKVLSLLWEMRGVRAEPVMKAPLLSNSLSEFWGARWNSAFNNLVQEVAFVPLARNIGGPPALLVVFVISGLVHELVVSLPAKGGFGLPTLYFLAQGIALLVERSQWGRRVGLGRGAVGRSFTLAVVAAPLFWLFHPLFVSKVIVPMLKAIGPI